MILSLFLANSSRNIYVEKHWRSVINRSVCDYFFEHESQLRNGDELQPVIKTPHHFLINISRDGVFYIAVCTYEVPPLFVIEFLNRFVDILIDYFSQASETVIKDNIIRVYELLDEMLDNGFPLATESNILQELVRPPNLLRSIADTVTGSANGSVGDLLPSGQLSNVPWRRSSVKYSRNEAYFDVTEEINAAIDRFGAVIHSEIIGHVDCFIKLSGTPDLTLTFSNPGIIEDVSLHPCVRYLKWERDKIISFIPPDGRFKLMTYQTSSTSNLVLPLSVRSNITFQENNSKLEVAVTAKRLVGKVVERARVCIRMPRAVINVSGTSATGKSSFDNGSKRFVWEIGRLEPQKVTTIKATISVSASESLPSCSPVVEVDFYVPQYTASGLRVSKVDMWGEKYRPFKGVKYVTRAGNYQVQS